MNTYSLHIDPPIGEPAWTVHDLHFASDAFALEWTKRTIANSRAIRALGCNVLLWRMDPEQHLVATIITRETHTVVEHILGQKYEVV